MKVLERERYDARDRKVEIERKNTVANQTPEYKRLIEDLGKAFEEFKSEHTRELEALKKGNNNSEMAQKLDKISGALDDFQTKKNSIDLAVKQALDRISEESKSREELERKLNKLRVAGSDLPDVEEMKAVQRFNAECKSVAKSAQRPEPEAINIDGYRAYKNAFNTLMRKGEKLLSAEEAKALQVGVDTDGGVMIPTDNTGSLVQKVFELSPIRQISSVQSISGDRLEGLEVLGEAGAGWVGEVTGRTETNTPTLGKYEIVAQEQYAAPRATQKLLDDASIDVESWLGEQVSGKFARLEGNAFVVGTGVAQPRGFTTYPTAATGDATRAWGTMEHIATGQSADFAASNPADKLFDLVYAMKPAYLANARFVTLRTVMAKIRKFKESTTNAYIWQPGLQQGQPDRLLGYPVVNAEDMPALAASSLSLAFGDFNQGYKIVDRLGIRTLRDPFTSKPYVIFYTIKRVGGAVINFEAIKVLKFV